MSPATNDELEDDHSSISSQPKAQPKSAANNKQKANAAKSGAGKGAAEKPRRGRNSRPSKKTEEELDSEMADYFTTNANTENASGAAPTVAAAAPAAPSGDASMDDDIMVRSLCSGSLQRFTYQGPSKPNGGEVS